MKFRPLNRLIKDPLTRRRLQRFKSHRRAYTSFLILMTLYVLSLGAEMLCNDRPLFVRYEGRFYFPLFKFYPESTFSDSGQNTRPNYRALRNSSVFAETPGNFMILPPIPYGPHEVLSTSELLSQELATLTLRPAPRAGYVNIDPQFSVVSASGAALFFNETADTDIKGLNLRAYWNLSGPLLEAISKRFANEADNRVEFTASSRHADVNDCELALATYEQRSRAPGTVRLTLREHDSDGAPLFALSFTSELEIPGG
ncbi:MAG: hypothetical protein O3C57_05140, partial [Verrucomicrobia bacterium]|nr:hypothetical protein [Verrucomicrobiota bacterium]